MSCFITKTEILYFFLDLLCSKFPLAYELVPATRVLFQTIRSTKALLADGTCVRLLVRVNTHVAFQMTRLTKLHLAHIAFVRFLVRVNTLVPFQITSCAKTLLANFTLVPSLSLHSFLSVVSSSSWGQDWRVQVFVFVVDDAFLDFLDDAFGLSRFSFRRRRREFLV